MIPQYQIEAFIAALVDEARNHSDMAAGLPTPAMTHRLTASMVLGSIAIAIVRAQTAKDPAEPKEGT
jgi:hypothetical protein